MNRPQRISVASLIVAAVVMMAVLTPLFCSLSCTANGTPATPAQITAAVNATTQAIADAKKDPVATANNIAQTAGPLLPDPWGQYLLAATTIGTAVYGAIQKSKTMKQAAAITAIDTAVSGIATSPTDHATLTRSLDSDHQYLIPATMATAAAAGPKA